MANINALKAFAGVQATVSTVALTLVTFGFTQAQIDQAGMVEISVNTNSIRIRYEGTAPTVSIGNILNSTFNGHSPYVYGNDNIQQLQLIRNGASDSEVFITLFK